MNPRHIKGISPPRNVRCRCGATVRETDATCSECGASEPAARAAEWARSVETSGSPRARSSTTVDFFRKRYASAYAVAAFIVWFASLVKAFAVLVGVLSIGAAIYILNQGQISSRAEGILAFILALFAASALFISALLLAAQGQVLFAHLDTAVNSSASLSEDEKLAILHSMS